MKTRIARRSSLLGAAAATAMLLAPHLAHAQAAPAAASESKWSMPTGIFGAQPGGLGTQPERPAPFVPAETAQPSSRSELKSTGMMAGGVVLTVLGTVGILGGIAAQVAASYIESEAGCGTPQQLQLLDACGGASTARNAGIVTLVASGALVLTGIPMIAIGGQTVQRLDTTSAGPTPTLLVGPGSAAVHVTF